MTTFFWFVAGLTLLVLGAELLVRGASKIALMAKISPLAVGLTVVAYGTSAPEMAVSVKAALAGQPDLAVGNVVGSNIFNVLFILGVSALIAPLVVAQKLIRIDVPVMIGVSVLLFTLSLDGLLSRLDGVFLLAGVAAYTIFAIQSSRKENQAVKKEYEEAFDGSKAKKAAPGIFFRNILMVLAGLGLLVLGARWLVESAVSTARHFGISELVIGLTLVAAGTSLPEVATSIMATLKGERDIAIGNVVGSNIFNILGILGVTSIIPQNGVTVSPAVLDFDLPVMIAAALACLPLFVTGHRIDRWEGGIFFFYYAVYTLYLCLNSVQHDRLPWMNGVMMSFVMPLTVLTMIVIFVRENSKSRS